MSIELTKYGEEYSFKSKYCNPDLEEGMKVFPEYNEEFLSYFEKNGTLDLIKKEYEENESDEEKIVLIEKISNNNDKILDLVYICSYMVETYENLINNILCYNKLNEDVADTSGINEALNTCMNICRVRLERESELINEAGEIIGENYKDTLLSLDKWQKNNLVI